MRVQAHRYARVLLVGALLVVAALALTGCPPEGGYSRRPGPAYDGSLKWAVEIAQPEIDAFSPDAVVYSVMGEGVYRDGRLPSNGGSWSLVSWSQSLGQTFQVTVRYDGDTDTTTRDDESPLSNTDGPLPVGWVNSTVVFSAAEPYISSHATHAYLAVFNTTSYPVAPDEAVWGIGLDTGPGALVKWDGTYLGES